MGGAPDALTVYERFDAPRTAYVLGMGMRQVVGQRKLLGLTYDYLVRHSAGWLGEYVGAEKVIFGENIVAFPGAWSADGSPCDVEAR